MKVSQIQARDAMEKLPAELHPLLAWLLTGDHEAAARARAKPAA